jgi:glycerol-3-phosphate dehydrogenase
VAEGGGILLITEVIRSILGTPCALLMGANIANEVALENYCEATIGRYKYLKKEKRFYVARYPKSQG